MAHTAVTAAAAANAGSTHPSRPALSLSFSPDGHYSPRTSEPSASDSEEEQSPITALDSSAALILVHDSDDSPQDFDFSDEDDDDRDELDELVSPMFQVRSSAACPPLPPSSVFLYLLAPLLKLGALNIQSTQVPLKFGLPVLFLSALASAFARQIWYMLARYLRKADMTDVLLNTFARGRGKERQRSFLRRLVKLGTSIVSVLVAVTYLRVAIFTLHPYLPRRVNGTISYILLTLIAGFAVSYLSFARNLAYRRVLYSTQASILLYLVWWTISAYAYTHQILGPSAGWLGSNASWKGIVTTVFAFCSSSTLPLYASLKCTSQPIRTAKTPKSRSFRILSLISLSIATLLLLASTLFAGLPNSPAIETPDLNRPITYVSRDFPGINFNSSVPPVLGTVSALPAVNMPSANLDLPPLNPTLAVLSALILLSGIPPIVVTTPSIIVPGLRANRFATSRILILSMVVLLSLIPPRTYSTAGDSVPYLSSSPFSAAMAAALVFFTLASTYFLPAFIHIAIHWFKKPLAIVVPPRTPLLQTPVPGASSIQEPEASTSRGQSGGSPRGIHDELLLRKERALQRRQLKKRIIWDIGSWVLVGGSIASLALAVSGFAGAWSS